MKKILVNTLLILLVPLAGFSQFTHVGPAAAYASRVKEPGFGIYGIFRVNDEIKLTPNFIYYRQHEISTLDGTIKYNWWMINLDGNYVILRKGIFEGYGLMGLNLANIKGERDEIVMGQPYKDKRRIQKLGLNIGAGVRLGIGDKITPFGELRYTLGSKAYFPDYSVDEVSLSQFSIYAGILIRITEDKDRSATEEF